jgi:NADPH:quinone reductase-like Zn-dependent oxidoreductase
MSNIAAIQKTYKSRPFSIEPAPMPTPKPHQIVIKTRAIGINPADAAVQNAGLVYAPDAHPVILGFDIAGEVHAVSDQVTRFKIGDRVCALPIDMGAGEVESKLAHGAFQLYCVSNASLAAIVPDNVSFSEAAVFPSCLSTAAWTMFTKDTMALDLPPIEGRAAPNGKVVIIWGGSSVVGSTAIQMAHLAGYTVIATSSELNFEHCRSLGAESVFDYKSPSVIEDIVAACKATGKESAGAFVAYFKDESTITCSKIVSQLGGSQVVGTVVPPQMPVPKGVAEGVKITSSESFPRSKSHDLHSIHP